MKYLAVDIETSGLDHKTCCIIEVGMRILNNELKEEDRITVLVEPDPEKEWETIAYQMHHKSGLGQRAQDDGMSVQDADTALTEFIEKHTDAQVIPLGNNVKFDISFINELMPQLADKFFYQCLDVSSVMHFIKTAGKDAFFAKKKAHTAQADLDETMAQLQFFRSYV